MLNTERLNIVSENTDLKNSKIAIIGIPFDSTVWSIPGQRLAPNAIREHLLLQECENNLSEVYDDGNLNSIHGNAKKTIDLIESNLEEIFEKNNNIIPIHLGGEHTITLGVIKTLSKRYKDLQVLSFDAHFDLKDKQFGEKFGHSTVMRRIYEITKDIIFFGARTGSIDEIDFAKKMKTEINPNKPTYISIDMDFFDPSQAPGVGDPESGGYTYQDFMELFKSLKLKKIIGVDIVEANPLIEKHITSHLASKLLLQFIRVLK
ncbi:MAG: agmatinase [Candidatus Aenigmarchaeota archaeon]|nr:agmatinase [Candidatus Aenigmarchaeota archaeon]